MTGSSGFTGTVTNYAGVPGAAQAHGDGARASAKFSMPHGIESDAQYIYIGDNSNNVIRRIDKATGTVSTIAGSPGQSATTDGTGSAARFKTPSSLHLSGGYLYIADITDHVIRRMNTSTFAVDTLAGYAGLSGNTNGNGTSAYFMHPSGMWSDGTNLYVSDGGNARIRKIVLATKDVTTFAGSTYGHTDGVGTAAKFKSPSGMASDGTNLYIADESDYVIRKIEIATATVTTLAGDFNAYGYTDGVGTAATFSGPNGIELVGDKLYLADMASQAIRVIDTTTTEVTTLAGNPPTTGTASGTGEAAEFNNPGGVTFDGTSLYIADMYNNAIRKID